MYSIKEFEEIKNFLESYGINFEESGRYDNNDFIVGHCLAINTEIFTDEINDEDRKYNIFTDEINDEDRKYNGN